MSGNTSSLHIFEMLREVCASREPLGVAELSRRLELSLSTAQRALLTLTQAGYLKRHPYVPKYSMGFTAERLVNALLERFTIRTASMLYLRRLAAGSRRTASLYVRLGWYSIRLVGVEAGNNPVPHSRRLGEAALLHTDAPSIAILAFLTDAELGRFSRFANTSAPKSRTHSRLAGIRAKGFAYEAVGENGTLESLAFPLRDATGSAVASVAIEGPPAKRALHRDPQLNAWREIVRELEHLIQTKRAICANPFAHIDPDDIHFGRRATDPRATASRSVTKSRR